jgi:hypothetical protein
MSDTKRYLHWTQRIALVRSSLHSASRSGDFTFFKSLQAAGMVEGTNHVAILSAEMGGEIDILLAAMDNLNAGLAYVHQDPQPKTNATAPARPKANSLACTSTSPRSVPSPTSPSTK